MRKVTLLSALLIGASPLFAVSLQAEDIDVERLWARNCKKCHGGDGSASTRVGKKLGLRDYTDPAVQATFSDEEAFKITKEGFVDESGEETMEGYGDKLSDEEIHALVAYIRTMDDANE